MILSNHYLLALGASILSALGQAIYVYACFTRHTLIKFAIGAFIAMPFLVGLVLFMGLFWWPWALLVLMLYVPWRWIDRRLTGGTAIRVGFGSRRMERQRAWFLTVTTLLIAVHAYAVIRKTEYEPVYSNYPMYADRLRAGSPYEAEFWTRFKPHDRHYKEIIYAVAQPKEPVNLTHAYAQAAFFARYSLWHDNIANLRPGAVIDSAARGVPIDADMCGLLRKLGLSLAVDGAPATMLRYAKRYFDLVDGKMVWVPVKAWIDVDITKPHCPYQISTGVLQALKD
jgi:hypothetical protein